jgi:hypothetical protein
MRDYDSERERPSVTRYYEKDGAQVTSRGPLKPYNELIAALADYAAGYRAGLTKHTSTRRELRKLAWFLGMNGETHACEAIMEKIPNYFDVER